MRISNLWWAVLPFCFFACGEEEQSEATGGTPVSFVATISPASRLTVNNSWAGLSDAKVGVEIGGIVKEYTVSEKGELTSAAPFYWEDLAVPASVNAWYPFNEGEKPETVVVSADQSVAENFLLSDLLEVNGASISESENTLTFVHRTARIECALTLQNGEEGSLNAATITLLNLSGVDEGNSVKMTGDYKALVAPQTLEAGTPFLEVSMSDGRSDEYVLPDDVELKGGYIFPVSVEVTPDGLQVNFGTPIKWEGETVGTTGESPEVGPDTDSGSWNNGGNDTTNGETSSMNPGTNTGEWNGTGVSTDAGTNDVNPGSSSSEVTWGGTDQPISVEAGKNKLGN